MSLPLSREVGSVYEKARALAAEESRAISTADVLLALFEVPSQAGKLLGDRSIDLADLQRRREKLGEEGPHHCKRVKKRSQRLAKGARSESVTTLHLLAALIREASSQARQLLEAAGADIGALRTAVMSFATSSRPVPRRYRDPRPKPAQPKKRDKNGEAQPTPIGFHPSLGIGRKKAPVPSVEEGATVAEDVQKAESSSPPPMEPRRGKESKEKGRRARIEHLRETGSGLALDNHPGINRGGRPRRSKRTHHSDTKQQEQRAKSDEARGRAMEEAQEDAEETTLDLAQRLFGEAGSMEPAARESTERKPGQEEPVENRQGRVGQEAKPDLEETYRLDADIYPTLCEFGRNLTAEAARGEIDPVVGRSEEIGTLIDILGKRRSNNPLLVGEPGVGKTAIVEGLAREFVMMASRGSQAGKRTIIELEVGRLLSGTQLRGAFSERLLGIKDEVAAAEGEVIVFLDEIHRWLGAGGGGDGADASGELKTALARGRFPCVGATTYDECREFVESDPAFQRRFQRVSVQEPDEETALRIVEGIRTHYERHHGIEYSPGALSAAVTLSTRYIHERQLPDKAIGVIDLAGSRASRQGEGQVDRDAIARVVADMASIPEGRLTGSDGARFLQMESYLSEHIVGHGEIVATISELLRRNYAGFRSGRPIGSLLFLGPTGVGKTEMVKVLADFLFHDREAIVRVDMSEYMESHSVSRLIGAPPGYVGHDQGGLLTERVRQRPYQVVLLDEIEKAHPDILNLLLQLFDEGQLTDGQGRSVDFSNTLVIMTSNLGSEVFAEQDKQPASPIGFSSRRGGGVPRAQKERRRVDALEVAQEHFTPELWNRIDERLVFLPLNREEIAEVAVLQLADSRRRLEEESNISMSYAPEVVEHLIDHGGYDPAFGARPMRQTIQRLVESKVATEILAGRARQGGSVVVDVAEGEIVVRGGQ